MVFWYDFQGFPVEKKALKRKIIAYLPALKNIEMFLEKDIYYFSLI